MMSEQEFVNFMNEFSGSEYLHKYMFNLKITDGVLWTCENAGNGCFWFADLISSWQVSNRKLINEEFQVWELKKTSETTAIVICSDGNKNILAKQNIPYTDFPYSQLTFWCIGDIRSRVILLPSEY